MREDDGAFRILVGLCFSNLESETMKKSCVLALTLALSMGGAIAYAAENPDPGKREFNAKCASCHGLSGKGDGPLAANLVKKPTDLTVIAKKNKGVLPVMDLEAVIDGRMATTLHGPRDMPVWGETFSAETGKDWAVPMGGAPFNPEAFVHARIMSLIDYIARLQVK